MTQQRTFKDALKAGVTAAALGFPMVSAIGATAMIMAIPTQAEARGNATLGDQSPDAGFQDDNGTTTEAPAEPGSNETGPTVDATRGGTPTGVCGSCEPEEPETPNEPNEPSGPGDDMCVKRTTSTHVDINGVAYHRATYWLQSDPRRVLEGVFRGSSTVGAQRTRHVSDVGVWSRKMERCNRSFRPVTLTQANVPVTTGTPGPVHVPAPVVPVYRPNTYITTNPGATGECSAAQGILNTIKLTTPGSVRVDPVLRRGQDYSQFSAAEVSAMNDCSVYGVIDRRGRKCTFAFDDARGGELFAEGGACPVQEETTPVAPAAPEACTIKRITLEEMSFLNPVTQEMEPWTEGNILNVDLGPNDADIVHTGAHSIVGYGCNTPDEYETVADIEYVATAAFDTTTEETLLTRGTDGKYVYIEPANIAKADFDLVREEPQACLQTLEQMCRAGTLPRFNP